MFPQTSRVFSGLAFGRGLSSSILKLTRDRFMAQQRTEAMGWFGMLTGWDQQKRQGEVERFMTGNFACPARGRRQECQRQMPKQKLKTVRNWGSEALGTPDGALVLNVLTYLKLIGSLKGILMEPSKKTNDEAIAAIEKHRNQILQGSSDYPKNIDEYIYLSNKA